jgi:hypothetical protein
MGNNGTNGNGSGLMDAAGALAIIPAVIGGALIFAIGVAFIFVWVPIVLFVIWMIVRALWKTEILQALWLLVVGLTICLFDSIVRARKTPESRPVDLHLNAVIVSRPSLADLSARWDREEEADRQRAI